MFICENIRCCSPCIAIILQLFYIFHVWFIIIHWCVCSPAWFGLCNTWQKSPTDAVFLQRNFANITVWIYICFCIPSSIVRKKTYIHFTKKKLQKWLFFSLLSLVSIKYTEVLCVCNEVLFTMFSLKSYLCIQLSSCLPEYDECCPAWKSVFVHSISRLLSLE